MLRRVSQVLRLLMLCIGAAVLLWLPASYFFSVWVIVPWPGAYGSMVVLDGAASFSTRQENSFIRVDTAQARVTRLPPHARSLKQALRPRMSRSMLPAGNGVVWQTDVSIPLWIFAALALAWPVTSLVRWRRGRRRRGFEVQPPGEPAAVEP